MAHCRIEPFEPTPPALEASSALLRTVFPSAPHLTPDYLRRVYLGNPLGPGWGLAAWDAEGQVAHQAVVPVPSLFRGRPVVGLWHLHSAVHPRARGRGLYVAMVEAVMEEALRRGFPFVMGVTNARSTPILIRQLPLALTLPLEVRLGMGTLPEAGVGSAAEFAPQWEDPALVAWRLGRHQRGAYRVRWHGDQACVYSDTGRLGIQVEIGTFHRSQLPELGELRSRNPLRLWIGWDPSRDWSGSAYLPVPVGLRPSPLVLLVRDLSGGGTALDPQGVRFGVRDFDAF